MDHFAKPEDELAIAQRQGTLQRNFQGYSTHADCDLVALGITGISHIGNTYCQNVKEIDSYRTRLEQESIPIEKGLLIDKDDQIRKRVIKSLICQFRLDFSEINRDFEIDFPTYFEDELNQFQAMIEDGLVEVDKEKILVTPRGRLLIRNICMVFDRYLKSPNSNTRFSRAI